MAVDTEKQALKISEGLAGLPQQDTINEGAANALSPQFSRLDPNLVWFKVSRNVLSRPNGSSHQDSLEIEKTLRSFR
jgi:hypothetical protein